MIKLKPINQQVVVIMGASSGIGRETARQFAQQGAKVVVSARSREGLDTLVQEIRRTGGQATAVVADVAEFDQVVAVAERAVSEFGRLDTWVHAAAVSLYATFEQTTPEEFKRVIEVNLVGQAYGAMAALPHIRREGRGALIHVSSIEAKRSFPYQSAYATSKHGIPAFLDALRVELAHDNVPISVTNIMPSGINTPLFNKARTKLGVKPMPVPPIYEPELVAEAILHAAEHPTRDLIVGGGGKAMAWGQRMSPGMMDMMVERTGFEGQRTDQQKHESAPDNLFEPIQGYDRVRGDFSRQAKDYSVSTWLDTNPIVKDILVFGALGAAGYLLLKSSGSSSNGNGNRHSKGNGSSKQKERNMSNIEQSIDVDVSVRVAYNQWTQFEEFPRFMEGVESIKQLDDKRMHWKATVAGKTEEWDAIITEQTPDQRIAWTNTTGAKNAGVVTFHRIDDNKTRVMLQLDYEPEGIVENVGDALGFVSRRVKGDMERFKAFIEERGHETGAWRGEIEQKDVV